MKTKVVTTSLFIAIVESPCFLTLVTTADAFSSHGASSSSLLWDRRTHERRHRNMLSQQRRISNIESRSMIFLREPGTQEATSASEKEDEPQTSIKNGNELPDVKDTVRKVGKKVGKAAMYGFSYFMNVVGLYFIAGLLLNVCGYAYEFSFEEGYKIDTIQNKRIEMQFERESRRYEREYDKMSQLSIEGEAATRLGSETVAELAGNTK